MKLIKPIVLLTVLLLLYSHVTIAQLKAGFTTDRAGGCSPVAIAFTNTTTGASAGAVYTWDFGNGNSAASFNAGAIYKDEKNYTVTLTVQDGGRTAVTTQTISVYAKPIVSDITVSPVKGCLPLNAVFTAAATPGSGSLNSYFWDFGDGNTQQGFSAVQQHVYTVPEKATVSVTVTNSVGCNNTLQKNNIVEIIPSIAAVFSASQTILCRQTDAVQFTNSSYGPGLLSYLWNFGDGTTSTLKTPSHTFNKKGIYTVTLTVTSTEGCVISNTQAGFINVASFSSDFTGALSVCKNDYLNFNNTSTPYPASGTWEVDGVTANYYANYFNYTFGTTGNHTIKLKNIFGTCPDSVTKTVLVKDIPYPNGFLDTILSNCGAPATVHFKDTTAGAVQWQWNFNSNYNYNTIDATTQAAAYSYSIDGGYYALLKVTNAAGCSASVNKYIGITRSHAYITADGNPVSCGPVKLIFTASSPDPILSYSWNFGDASYSTMPQPQHTFSNPGNFPVTLTYTNNYGCTETVSYGVVRVYGKTTAGFTAATTICGNTPVIFTAAQPAGDISYFWDFGDNSSVYNYGGNSISHQYNYDSTYTVTLIVANGGNCRDTVTKKDYIKVLPPFPHISGITNTCDGTRGLVTFTQDSKKGQTFTWNFGDGSTTYLTADQPSVSHTYTKSGHYNTVLTVTNGQCTLSTAVPVYVLLKQSPVFTTDRTEACVNEPFGYQINNIEPNPYQVSYQNSYNYVKWQNSDGSNFNGNINYNYNYYNYWLTNTNGTAYTYSSLPASVRVIFQSYFFGCNDTTNFVAMKFKGAVAGFAVLADGQCWQQPVVFNDTSKAMGSSQIIRRDWNFGDGTTQSFTTGGTISHQYNNPGNYYVGLTITDAGGCVSTISSAKYIEVNGPKAAFSPSPAYTTITLPVYFYNNTNNYNSYTTQYKWDFGDGNTSADYSPSHAYASPGQYTVTLVAINPVTLCSDTATQVVTIINFVPAFSFSNTIIAGKCPPVLVRFSNNSYNYNRVTWDFGDGITADNLNYPSHIYKNPGKYIVTLYVYGPSGLTATYTDSVVIRQPAAALRTDTADICLGGKVSLTATVSNTLTYLWDFGDGNIVATADSITAHLYTTAGLYRPSIMAADANGCATLTPLSETINVHNNPAIIFSPAQPVVCKGNRLQINASASSANSYAWAPSAGLNNPAIASPYASPDTSTLYTVTVKDNIGCSSKAALKVTVAQPFTLKAPADAAICFGKSIQLTVTGADTYKWINNTAGLSNIQSAYPTAGPFTTTTYTVTGTDQYKCFTDTAQVTITVMALPAVNAGPDQEVQLATATRLPVTTDNDVIKWNWSPAAYLNCTDCPSPISTPLAQTAYTVSVTNKNGCVASDTIIIKVQCQENTVRIPNVFTPNNDNNNDVFMIKGISLVKHLIIYDRWGEKVFERNNFIASDRSACWDGTFRGRPAPEGSFVYYAEMQCPAGGSFLMKGSVILIR